jgi:hypothetical protein
MSQTANVVVMPKPSDKNAEKESTGHRSTLRAVSAADKLAGADEHVRSEQAEPSTEVYAVFGVEPEIQAYAMAKYSRSALSMKESLR